MAVTAARGVTLQRLSPQTLKLTGRWRIASRSSQGLAPTALAAAGAGLWAAAGNRLVRLSLPGARITASIIMPGAARSDLSADAAGTVLIVGESDSATNTCLTGRPHRFLPQADAHPGRLPV